MTHLLLAERGLAAPLLARFQNGLLYGYTPGRVCTPEDLRQEAVWRAVANQLGKWHGRPPLPKGEGSQAQYGSIWSVIEQWTSALPTRNEEVISQKQILSTELKKSYAELQNTTSLDHKCVCLTLNSSTQVLHATKLPSSMF